MEFEGEFGPAMVDGIHRFLDRELEAAAKARDKQFTAWTKSAEQWNGIRVGRQGTLAGIIGAGPVDGPPPPQMLVIVPFMPPIPTRESRPTVSVHAVRWPVLPGVEGEGLLIWPAAGPGAVVIAIPDAGQFPEDLAGLQPPASGSAARECRPEAINAWALRLADSGCVVVIPTIIDREKTPLRSSLGTPTDQSRREFLYRAAFETGRHPIGYEVRKIRAAIDWAKADERTAKLSVAVAGWGEGGLLALCSAVLDERIDAALISGYLRADRRLWEEPLERNVWNWMTEFDDSQLAALIAPRRLIVEAARGPELEIPTSRPAGAHAAPGRLTSPSPETVAAAVDKAAAVYRLLGKPEQLSLIRPVDARPMSDEALQTLLGSLGHEDRLASARPADRPLPFAGGLPGRQDRQFMQLIEDTQRALATSERNRAHPVIEPAAYASPDAWLKCQQSRRSALELEVIGSFGRDLLAAKARSRRTLESQKWIGYEVMLDVWPDVFAAGVLLVPRDLEPGERRPVVVWQHGLAGVTSLVVDRSLKSPYNAFGAALADRGYIVYAPQNPYVGGVAFRQINRKANPLGRTLWTFIVAQHRQTTAWLAGLPFVDPARIAFYGLSYGGKTAMHVPPLVEGYSLVICSGDFNDMTWKKAGIEYPYGFMFVEEYEIPEWNMANRFNYAELAGLICPRPFMVERGHNDPVARDEYVAWEYAKVKHLYDRLGIGERTAIEYFMGGHEIHGVGTFAFLDQQLGWKAR